ncbi:MAG: restriction endonuclease subunit S [Gallionellaceae bacterium]|nr:MAG: restriction endonuclease subunit S [Gallionellaceae bacterium]
MSSEWCDIAFGDFIALQRGHDLPDQERRPGTVPILGSFGVTGYHDTVKAKAPGVTIGRSGASFGVAAYTEKDYWPLNTALYVTDFKDNDPKFVFYFLKLFNFSGYNSGSAQPSLNRNNLYGIPIRVPSKAIQKCIANFVSALDDRIALLRASNATLEAIAQAMFKSWFVDFDPVHANASLPSPRGRGVGGEGEIGKAKSFPHPSPLPAGEGVQSMSEATAALFPDSFEESELGLVPRGWRVGTLGDIAKTVKKQLQPSALHSELHYVGLEHIPRKSLSLSDWGDAEGLGSAKAAFAKDDILFGKLRPYFHKVVIAPFDGVCSTDILVCQSTKPAYYGLAAMHLFSKTLIDYAERLSNGAKMPRVNWKDLAAYPICVPPEALAANYSEIIKPIISRMMANVHQAQTLATLRDTLLPRLISGQLRLPQACAELEEA